MDRINKYLKWTFWGIAIISAIVVIMHFPSLGYFTVSIAFFVIVGWVMICLPFCLLLFLLFYPTSDHALKIKYGKDFKKAIEKGQLSVTSAYPCVPNGYYTSHNAIEEKCNIVLPDYNVKECRETLPDFTGDYFGSADIEFTSNINSYLLQQIDYDMKQKSSKWRKGEAGDEYICDLEKPDLDAKPSKDVFWQISIQKGTNKGKIMYGRI